MTTHGGFPGTDKDAIVSVPRGPGTNVLATVNRYDPEQSGAAGALVEETSAFRLDVEQFYDLHTVVWDGRVGEALAARDDAVASDVSYESPRVPEVHVTNEFAPADGTTATLEQDVLVAVEEPALCVRNRASFARPGDRTLYTVVGLGIDDVDEGERDVDLAYRERGAVAEYVVAADGDRFLAVTQARPATGHRAFDGCRIGRQGVREGPRRSAWADVYAEADGWVSDLGALGGKVDAGVGLYVGAATEPEWLTVVGFGRTAEDAIGAARRVVDAGYEAVRESFRDAWVAWHDARPDPPVAGRARELYELSLSSVECAQDPAGGHVAGAFKPWGMEYKHVWPRDQVVVVAALLAAGAHDEALTALEWLAEVQITDGVVDARGIDRGGSWWQNYYATGEPRWRSLQLDQVGGPIYAHWLAWRETGDDAVRDAHYATSRRAAEFLLAYDNGWGFPRPHQDPWEETWGHTTGGTAAAVAGLRCAAALADSRGETEFAAACRERADVWASNLETYCLKDGLYGSHYVTADSPERTDEPPADERPDAIALSVVWPWNLRPADHDAVQATLAHARDPTWCASGSPCLGRYPGDDYTPTRGVEDGGWPVCEAYADVVRWLAGTEPDAVADYVHDHADGWTTAAGLLPERVDGRGRVRWNSNLQWSQAAYVLLAASLARGEAFGLAPPGGDPDAAGPDAGRPPTEPTEPASDPGP
jgi:GH15 family glucan-1,4-alpha-glucosidase